MVIISMAAVPVSNTLSDFNVTLSQPYIALFASFEDAPTVFRIVKFGFNFDVDLAAAEDSWSIGGTMTYPSASQTMNIVSSSTADDLGGTGAETLLINCIGSDGTESEVTATMDGTTTVLTTEDCIFINRAVVATAGSGTRNAGNITITQSVSGLVMAHIPATYSTTQQTIYRVPSDRRCYINEIFVSADKLAAADTRVIFYIKITSGGVEQIVRHELIDTRIQSSRVLRNIKGAALAPNDIIRIQVATDTNDSIVGSEIDMTCSLLPL
jgi:hypothetical protein